jgi:hypothetical protein
MLFTVDAEGQYDGATIFVKCGPVISGWGAPLVLGTNIYRAIAVGTIFGR